MVPGKGLRRLIARPQCHACMLRLLSRGHATGDLLPSVLASRPPVASRNLLRSLRTGGAREGMTFLFGRNRASWMTRAIATVASVIERFSLTCMRLRG